MHKRVLVAEPADTIRSVAESVLRQNGFEVISVISADKALEVLQFTTPDVLIIGADLKGPDGRPFYERVQDNPKTSSLPLLLFDSSESEGLPFPDEVIIPRPFDPKDFIQRVLVFSGQAHDQKRRAGTGSSEDDFLDAALGVDNLQVTESEVMNQANMTGKLKAATVEKMVGMDHVVEHDDEMDESGRVESLMIRDDETISTKNTSAKKAEPPVKPGTGKIELADDQYGISDPAALAAEDPDPDHDYNWFINSMRDEVSSQNPAAKPAQPAAADSEPLAFESPSASVDPVTPPPATVSKPTPQQVAQAEKKSAGVEKFIDEFREEMERIRSDNEPEIVSVKADRPAGNESGEPQLSWEEKLENITPEHLAVFTRQLAAELGKSLAARLMKDIDTETLLKHIAREVADRFVREKK